MFSKIKVALIGALLVASVSAATAQAPQRFHNQYDAYAGDASSANKGAGENGGG